MRNVKILLGSLVAVLLLVVLAYYAGPRPEFDPLVSAKIEVEPLTLQEIDSMVAFQKLIPNLKRDNETRIYWADSMPKVTRYAVVYLHGFTASPEEGATAYEAFAKRYGFNTYVPLLPEHGIADKDVMADVQPNDWIIAAKEAVNVGQSIGEDVILMSCSTGGTLSVYLAAENPELIDLLLLYSPNIKVANPLAGLTTGPWGKELAYKVEGKYRDTKDPSDPDSPTYAYWTTEHRIEGIIALQKLLDLTMTEEVFSNVQQPYFLGCYYKNEEEQDQTVSVEAMRWFHATSATPDSKKEFVSFPNAKEHVITSDLVSDDVETVLGATYTYIEETLGIEPK